MQLIPTEDEVVALLRETGALRSGHFQYPNGLHSDRYLQVSMAMRHYETAKLLSVALSRKLRAHPEIRAIVSELSIVTPATAGLPVAYGMCEALRAKQVYWAERGEEGGPLRFRPYQEPVAGEKVLLVDDVLRSGRKLTELRALIESMGATVVGLAVIVYQPNPETPSFGDLPFYYLASLDAMYYWDKAAAADKIEIAGPVSEVWV
ncbi:MAG: phosphoribosyltransferase [Acidobacteria bacterium]|nr:phosphoribosyltransferase [Acidobacteriota bacterium]